MFVPGRSELVHPGIPGLGTAKEIKAQVKLDAEKDVFKPAAEIVMDVTTEKTRDGGPADSFPYTENLIIVANYTRAKDRPDDPADLDFDPDLNFYLKSQIVIHFCRLVPYSTQYSANQL